MTEVHIYNAFSNNDHGGNPAAVVNRAGHLSHRERQALATRLGLSETVFIDSSDKATRRLSFYTPYRQIAHCGHATVAAFAHLARRGELGQGAYSKETIDGQRQIEIRPDGVFMQQQPAQFTMAPVDAALQALGVSRQQLAPHDEPVIGDTGNRFLLLPFRSVQELRAVKPDLQKIADISKQHDLIGFYPYVQVMQGPVAAAARMFAPHYGINEESATGMAAGPLGVWLTVLSNSRKWNHTIMQGVLMDKPSPSRLQAELRPDSHVWVGGQARHVKTLQL